MSLYLGCDNGIGGALAVYDSDKNEIVTIPMPIIKVQQKKGNKNTYDIPTIVTWFKSHPSIRLATLERAQAFPGQGVVSQFNIGRGFGIIEGILAALEIPYQVIHPKTWQKKMFEGINHTDTKQSSIIVAQRLFPATRFVAPGATKLHDGLSDSSLLAYYGYLIHKPLDEQLEGNIIKS